MLSPWALPIIILCAGASYFARKLTLAGASIGALIAGLCYLGAGWTGLVMLGDFFVTATLATSVRFNQKVLLGLSEGVRGRRRASQVIANGGVAAICCTLAFLIPGYQPMFALLAAAAFSAAAADSVSSEIGNAYGSRFFNIISLKKDARGLDGVVSLEGTAAGMVASSIIGVIHAAGAGFDRSFLYIVVGGTAGNLFDSILGAAFERKGWLGNDEVNFLNTGFGAGLAYLLLIVFG